MKLSFEEIRKKHLEGVNGVYKYLQDSKFNPFLVESSEEFTDIKFERLCSEYSNYANAARAYENNERYVSRVGKKNIEKYMKIVKKYTRKQYVEDRINKYVALDHLYHGDIMCQHPLEGWGHMAFKVSNSRFLRRYPISRFKGHYIILYNPEDISKSKVMRKSHVKSYFSSICDDAKWKKMPSKKRNSVFQCMDKFENYCTLEEFCTLFIQYQIIGENDFPAMEHSFFIKRDYNKRDKK